MPDSDLTPTFPRNSVPLPERVEEEQLLLAPPNSLAPISGTRDDQSDGSGEPESVWTGVWRGRWLVVGAAIVAFSAALAFGRWSTRKDSVLPLPMVSGATSPSKGAPSTGAQIDLTSSPVHSNDDPSLPATREAATVRSDTRAPAITSDSMALPPMEVPPVSKRNAGSSKDRAHRTQSAPTTLHKRFSPTEI